MPDREKYIEILSKAAKTVKEFNEDTPIKISLECVEDILELLKEQEAVEPKQVGLYGKDDWYGLVCVCPDCKAEWMSDEADTHFCPKCGQAVKWE